MTCQDSSTSNVVSLNSLPFSLGLRRQLVKGMETTEGGKASRGEGAPIIFP